MAGNSESLNIDITADAKKATKEIDGLQKKVDKLEQNDVEIPVDADTKAASKALDAVEKQAKQLDVQDFEITVDAKVDKALGELDRITAKAKETADTAELIGRALGPELAAQSDTTAVVGELERMGLSLDEIKANADQLGLSLKEAAGADVGGKLGASLGTARGKIDEMSDSARGANSALANMIGNTSQDLGGLTGLVGSLGVGVGQLGEYAADAALGGEKLGSALTSMVKVAGPMAGLAAVTFLVSNAMKEASETKAFHADEVDAYAEAVRNGEDATEALVKRLRDVGKVMGESKFTSAAGLFGIGDATTDFMGKITKAGLSVEQYAKLVTGTKADIIAWGQAQVDAGADAKLITDVMGQAADAADDYAAGQKAAATSSAFFGTAVEDAARKTAMHASAMEANAAAAALQAKNQDDLVSRIDGVNSALDEQVAALEETEQGYRDAQAAQEEMIDSALNAADSGRDAADKFRDLGEVLKDHKKTSEEVTDATIAFAKAQEKAKDDSAAASGQIRTNTEKVDSLNDSLLGTAAASETGRAEIVDYIGTLNGIPEEKKTEILAALARGDVAEAKRIIDEASATRTVAIGADTSKFDGDVAQSKAEAAKPVTVVIKYREDQRYGPHAKGGTVGPAGGLAGEAGPEFVQLPGRPTVLIDSPMIVPPRTRVTSVRKTRAILSRRTPRYANGTQTPAPLPGGAMSFTFNQQAPIYGVSDLDRHLAAWSQRLAQQISAGKR